MTQVEFILRSGEKIIIDSKQVKNINSSREDGSHSTVTMLDGTVYKIANSFYNVSRILGFKLRDDDEI